jgi:soluble lytic murein transglycosylase-like protein
VKAVIHAESAFDPRAISNKGAQGLMQLMPGTAQQLGVDDPFNPWQNIEAGVRYLSSLSRGADGSALQRDPAIPGNAQLCEASTDPPQAVRCRFSLSPRPWDL